MILYLSMKVSTNEQLMCSFNSFYPEARLTRQPGCLGFMPSPEQWIFDPWISTTVVHNWLSKAMVCTSCLTHHAHVYWSVKIKEPLMLFLEMQLRQLVSHFHAKHAKWIRKVMPLSMLKLIRIDWPLD